MATSMLATARVETVKRKAEPSGALTRVSPLRKVALPAEERAKARSRARGRAAGSDSG